jgi:hypothetical protein
MLRQFVYTPFSKVLLLAIITVQLVACGSSSGSATAVDNAAGTAANDIVLAGSVGDGPVTGATIEVLDSKGRLIRTLKSDNTASFSARMRVWRSSYPLLLRVRGGVDLVTGNDPDFQMVSVMLDRHTKAVNINPFSTLIVKIAQSLPNGINAANIEIARAVVMGKLGFGLDQSVIADPISSVITDANAANLMKSSEVAGEMVRRTRDQIAATGRKTSGDAVLAAIAADMQDGRLDGQGAAGTDPQISAVARVVSGQVLVEALANTLKVSGIIATDVIDQAIKTTRSGRDSVALTQSVRATGGMLQQTHTALAAASVLDSGSEVTALKATVSGIAAGALPGDVANILPADSSRSLDTAVLLAATANLTQVDAVNAAGQTGTSDSGKTGSVTTDTGTTGTGATNPGNTRPVSSAPVISGWPALSVEAGTAYNFKPTASDADGDVLTFSIAGMPSWAGFNAVSGRLSGVPGDSDIGTYSHIVITVTDGTDTVSLPAFSLIVEPVQRALGGFSLTWTAPVARADGSPLPLSEIDGFRIYYGTAAGNYPNVVDVSDGSAQSTTVSNLPAGNYHVVMTSYDINGLESGYSMELVKTVQ